MAQSKVTQSDQVVAAIKPSGGRASLAQLYRLVGADWKTETPEATVRRIVQTDPRIARVVPGLYCLSDRIAEFQTDTTKIPALRNFYHTLYQAVLIELGNQQYDTYVAPQDKNKSVVGGRTLSDKCTLSSLPEFWPVDKAIPLQIMKRARNVDVVWVDKKRKMPKAFYEVEITSGMDNSLVKFHELQDYRAEMWIVAPESRRRMFETKIGSSVFADLREIVRFKSTEEVNSEAEQQRMGMEAITSEMLSEQAGNF